jgi:hypothetical protein
MTFREKILLALLLAVLIFVPILGVEINKKIDVYQDQVITLDGGTYDIDVTVIVTADTEKAMEFVVENTTSPITSEDFVASGTTFSDEEGNIIVWLSSAQDKGVISHELLHATISIMSWAGIPFNESTEESYAYELQYLTNQFYKQIK